MISRLRFCILFALIWMVSGWVPVWGAPPPDTLRIHYYRPQADFDGWGLHVWGDGLRLPVPVRWNAPLYPTGLASPTQVYFDIPLSQGAKPVFFILHKAEWRHLAEEQRVVPDMVGREIWLLQDDSRIYTSPPAKLAVPAPKTSPDKLKLEKSLTSATSERARIEAELRKEYEDRLRKAADQEYQLALKRLELEQAAQNNKSPPSQPEPVTPDYSTETSRSGDVIGISVGGLMAIIAALLAILVILVAWFPWRLARLSHELQNKASDAAGLQTRIGELQSDAEISRQRALTLEKRLNTVFTQSADMLAVFSVELGDSFRLTAANHAFFRLTGWSDEVVVDRRIDELPWGATAHAELLRFFREVVRHPESSRFRLQVGVHGNVQLLDVQLTPITVRSGFCTHILFSARPAVETNPNPYNQSPMSKDDSGVDPLTGLADRETFMQKMALAFARGQRRLSPISVLLVDIRDFHRINAQFGYDGGDTLLRAVAQRLSSTVRSMDFLARTSSNEFSILLDEGSSMAVAMTLADKIMAAVARPIAVGDTRVSLTFAIGISTFPDDGRDADTLLGHADEALRRAKARQGQSIETYSGLPDHSQLERLALETSLRQAIPGKQFFWAYQPVMHPMDRNRVIGFEALLRWQHPDFGLVLPAQFLAVTHSIGIQMDMLEYGLKRLGEEMAGILTAHPEWGCSINLSSNQVFDNALLGVLERTVPYLGFAPKQLSFEIPESVLSDLTDHGQAILNGIAKLGVQIIADDFGSGYSMLSLLKRHSVSSLKLDRMFISLLPHDPNAGALVSAIIQQARDLDLSVIAKGVETDGQASYLANLGCHGLQGFLFAPPIPPTDFSRRLAL